MGSEPATTKILVTGAGGQLGLELCAMGEQAAAGERGKAPHGNRGAGAAGASGLHIIGLSRSQLDITDLQQCREALALHQPQAVIHCAAYTAVDQAEAEPDAAYRINAAGTRNLALAAREHHAKLAYISTDYVFDGTSAVPYNEADRPNPRTVYGKSKLAGEQLVQTLHDRYFIVRTSWVYGRYGRNFVQTMLQLGELRDELKVVSDQLGSPTYTFDLARFLLELVQTDYYGIYHASNQGTCSWYEFAQAIFHYAGNTRTQVLPCSTDEFPRPAPRPAYSMLDHTAIRTNGFTLLPPWRESLQHCIHSLNTAP
ncbi:dTDP-4-dehydrorhamnose reductase [Paenibacillus sp. GCM10023252]|uniref:dTDP-4-dehydrorhamnose reductase n=1 Tax=Paenibacillus sp. GCM10023252 TaxID=3252649 RepID=UPI00360CE019